MTEATQGSIPIGIVVPAHNAGRFLRDTLESVQGQSHRQWTCVVVNDGSRDETSEIARSFVREDPRFRLVERSQGGPCLARNFGFGSLPRGTEYVTFMDADDCWTPDALAVLLGAAEASVDFVGAHGLGEFIDERGQPMLPGEFSEMGRGRLGSQGGRQRPWPPDAPTVFENVVTQSICFPPGLVLAKASAYRQVGLFDPRARLAEDWDILVRLTRLGALAFVDRVVLGYRRHASNVSTGAGVAEAATRVWRRAYWSSENSPAQRQIVGDAWRATQVVDAHRRWQATVASLRSRELLGGVANLARLPVIAGRYASGRPPHPPRTR